MTLNGIGGAGDIVMAQTMANSKKLESKTDSFQSALDDAMADKDRAQLKKACIEFESYFLQTMFREMRKTTGGGENSFIPKSQAENIFQDMLDEEYAKNAAQTGGIGLADMMYRQMSKNL